MSLPSEPSIAVITAVNDQRVYEANLLRSPMLVRAGSAGGAARLVVERGHTSAARAYNAGAAKATEDLLVYAHQDVYLPSRWHSRLLGAVQHLDTAGVPWGVLGVWGVSDDGRYLGRVWCSGSNQEFAGPVHHPERVASIDEIVIVTRRSSGLKFDEELPGFHLYATDIVHEARMRGLETWVFDGPTVHNSRTVPQLGAEYVRAYRYMQSKWRSELPLRTCVVPLTRNGWPLRKYRVRVAARKLLNRVVYHSRHDSPLPVARKLGYEA